MEKKSWMLLSANAQASWAHLKDKALAFSLQRKGGKWIDAFQQPPLRQGAPPRPSLHQSSPPRSLLLRKSIDPDNANQLIQDIPKTCSVCMKNKCRDPGVSTNDIEIVQYSSLVLLAGVQASQRWVC